MKEIIKKYYKVAIITLLLIAIYFPTIRWMIDRWSAHDSYFGHGFLVPFVSLYILWSKREKLKKMKSKPTNIGIIFMVVGLLIHMLSAFFRIYFTSAYSFIFVLVGIVLYFFGFSKLKESAFPIAFLLFMIPLPLVAIVNITFRMKLLAAQWSTIALNKMGFLAILEGSLIKMKNAYLMVEDQCSGLRSLISLLALGALVAYFSNLSRIKRVIVIFGSVIIALLANVVRIVLMSVVSELYGIKFIEGFMHTLSGLSVFVIAFILLAALVKSLE